MLMYFILRYVAKRGEMWQGERKKTDTREGVSMQESLCLNLMNHCLVELVIATQHRQRFYSDKTTSFYFCVASPRNS